MVRDNLPTKADIEARENTKKLAPHRLDAALMMSITKDTRRTSCHMAQSSANRIWAMATEVQWGELTYICEILAIPWPEVTTREQIDKILDMLFAEEEDSDVPL